MPRGYFFQNIGVDDLQISDIFEPSKIQFSNGIITYWFPPSAAKRTQKLFGYEDLYHLFVLPQSNNLLVVFSNLVNFMKLVALVDEDEDMQSVTQEQVNNTTI